jgi:hypothetical protein
MPQTTIFQENQTCENVVPFSPENLRGGGNPGILDVREIRDHIIYIGETNKHMHVFYERRYNDNILLHRTY